MWVTGHLVVAVAYISIALTIHAARVGVEHRVGLPSDVRATTLMFKAFIVACSGTHIFAAVTVFWPAYPLATFMLYVCATVSVAAASKLPKRSRAWVNRIASESLFPSQTDSRVYVAMFDDSPIGQALVHPDGRWLMVNRTVEEITGYTSAELRDMTWMDITEPDDIPGDAEDAAKVVTGELRRYSREKQYRRKDGKIVDILLSVTRVREVMGEPVLLLAQIQDITAQKRDEVQAMTQTERLSETVARLTKDLERAEGRFREHTDEKVSAALTQLDDLATSLTTRHVKGHIEQPEESESLPGELARKIEREAPMTDDANAELVILIRTAQQALDALTARVASIEDKLDTDRLDMRELRTQFTQVMDVSNRLERAVFSGNGREPLTAMVSRLSLDHTKLLASVSDLKVSVERSAEEQRKFDRDLKLKLWPAFVTGGVSIIVALIALMQ